MALYGSFVMPVLFPMLLGTIGCGGIAAANVSASSTTLIPSSDTLDFAPSPDGGPSLSTVSLANESPGVLTVSAVNVTGTGFSLAPSTQTSFTIPSGGSASLSIQFDSKTNGASDGDLSVMSASSSTPLAKVHLHGAGSGLFKSVTCHTTALIGTSTDACVVTCGTKTRSCANRIDRPAELRVL